MKHEPKKPKTKAKHHAHRNVTLTQTGSDNYIVSQYDPKVSAWRQGPARPFDEARVGYCQALLDHAREFLGKPPVQYDGGPWTYYI